MIEHLRELPEGVDGITARGKITARDYREVLRPLLQCAQRNGYQLRLLYHIASDAEFSAGAALEDARLGLSGFGNLERCAVVSDTAWIAKALRFLATIAPCPIRVYGESEWNDAVSWLSSTAEPGGIPYELLKDSGVLVVRPSRRISTEDIASLDAAVAPWLQEHGKLSGIIVHAARFPGWESLGSLFRHAWLLSNRHGHVERVAFVIDGTLPELASGLATRLVSAEVRHFAYDDYDSAMAWIRATSDDSRRSREAARGAPRAEATS